MATTDSILHETNWENMMRSSIQQSLLKRMKQDDKKQQSLKHECRECGEKVNIKDGYKWFRESDTYECLECFNALLAIRFP